MALIAEDGSSKPDANSYISLEDADAYHALRGNTDWEFLNDEVRIACLVRATDFLTQEYRSSWKGARTTATQALDWPRAGVVIEDLSGPSFQFGYGRFQVAYNVVPTEVKNACAELGLRASIQALVKDQTRAVISETVGPISIVYDKSSPQQTKYSAVAMMLEPYLKSNGAMVKLSRT